MADVDVVVDAATVVEGEGMVVRRALPNGVVGRIDPFLLLDHMGPWDFGPGEAKGAPDHPHRGFETVTYLLEGHWEHRDSEGNAGELHAGDVQWMTAGHGVVHSEMPAKDILANGGRLNGFQLWVNLPAKDKLMTPRYQDIPAADIPEVPLPEAEGDVRVLAGAFGGASAVIDTRTPITFLHLRLSCGTASLPVPAGHHGFVYCVKGAGVVGGQRLEADQLGRMRGDGSIEVHSEQPLSLLLLTGVPIGEPVAQWGPFVMNTNAEILQAFQDYEAGNMGKIAPASA